MKGGGNGRVALLYESVDVVAWDARASKVINRLLPHARWLTHRVSLHLCTSKLHCCQQPSGSTHSLTLDGPSACGCVPMLPVRRICECPLDCTVSREHNPNSNDRFNHFPYIFRSFSGPLSCAASACDGCRWSATPWIHRRERRLAQFSLDGQQGKVM